MNEEPRASLRVVLRNFFNESIPKSIGWRNTTGSVVGALILAQIVTGVLIAIYYVPHPESASASLKWMEANVPAGTLIRALHYWGASYIVVAVFVHILRVFFSGAYRRPRQGMWLTGVVLLTLTVTIAFSGQLLPYNQTGYWAAKVGVEIAATAPLIGETLKRLMLGGDSIGELTLTRFYALHIVVLPAMLGLFIVCHLFYLRKHGPLRAAKDRTEDMTPFYPMQFARDMIVISVVLASFIGVSYWAGSPRLEPIDLANSTYVPRPEWYFLSHFELLRMTPSSLEVLTTFVLPAGLILLVLALPWIDRAQTSAAGSRRGVRIAGALVALAIVGLTIKGLIRHQTEHTIAAEVEAPPESSAGQNLLAEGRRIVTREKCIVCHKLNGRGGVKAGDLAGTGMRLQEDYLRAWLRDPQSFRPDIEMPPVTVPDAEFEALVQFLRSLEEPR